MRRNPKSWLSRSLAAGLVLAAAAPLSPGTSGAGRSLGLFQRIARSDLVVHVRVREGALKFAVVEVIETLKGEPPDNVLRIAFRDFNRRRPPGEEAMVFPDGQEELLFLVPYRYRRKKEKHQDLYELFRGAEGRITIPAEGSGTLTEAITRLVELTQANPLSQVEGLRELLTSKNPFLLEAALEELERLRAVSPTLLPDLVTLLGSRAPQVRVGALRLIQQVFGAATAPTVAGAETLPERVALQAVLERARNDAIEEVRVEAVSTLSEWPRIGDVEADLRAIAEQDPAQLVRYEAERALFKNGMGR